MSCGGIIITMLLCYVYSSHGAWIWGANQRLGDIPSQNDTEATEDIVIQRENERSKWSE